MVHHLAEIFLLTYSHCNIFLSSWNSLIVNSPSSCTLSVATPICRCLWYSDNSTPSVIIVERIASINLYQGWNWKLRLLLLDNAQRTICALVCSGGAWGRWRGKLQPCILCSQFEIARHRLRRLASSCGSSPGKFRKVWCMVKPRMLILWSLLVFFCTSPEVLWASLTMQFKMNTCAN